MADYPASIFAPRTTENVEGVSYNPALPTKVFAEDYSLPSAEIVAIEETLGLNPQGDDDTVAERLTAIEAIPPSANGLGIIAHGATSGTARPSTFGFYIWVGSVEPTNAINGDVWLDTA